MLLCFDARGQVRDFYFPYAGQENHVRANNKHRIGVWSKGIMRWMDDESWTIGTAYQHETLASHVTLTTAYSKELSLEIRFEDIVYNEADIFLRSVEVINHAPQNTEVRVFFAQQFSIYGTRTGDTAYFDPRSNAIVHYKGKRAFLISGQSNGKGFDQYSVGHFDAAGKEGTWRDADDGILMGNPVEHGSVDSVIGFTLALAPRTSKHLSYWVTVATTIGDTRLLHEYIQKKTPKHLLESTEDFWHAWVNKSETTYAGLNERAVDLYKKSLLIMRSHVNDNGSIIASGDGDMLQYGMDSYTYAWPRDASYICMAFDKAGYSALTQRFFSFCRDVLSDDGYFFHKYRPDKSLGSSWHPWVGNGKVQLPIQEDETAVVLVALWHHYECTKNLEFIEELYNPLIKRAADFLFSYRDPATHLPLPSYGLWEEHRGVFTYTASAVAAGLKAASKFAHLLGKEEEERRYMEGYRSVHDAILNNLVDEETGLFVKMIGEDGKKDQTLDMSVFFGLLRFNILPPGDSRMEQYSNAIHERLCCKSPIGGVPRYEGDRYLRVTEDLPGNPWIITTLWLAQYDIAKAETELDLEKAFAWIQWTLDRALPSGILPEQVHPYTGEQLSASPLAWSHAEFITTCLLYLEKLQGLSSKKARTP